MYIVTKKVNQIPLKASAEHSVFKDAKIPVVYIIL